MSQSSTLYIGMDVHKESIAVAYVSKDHDAEVVYLGPIGTRPCDSDQRVRKLQSTAKHLVFVDDAGPCGSWLYRYLSQKATPAGSSRLHGFPSQAYPCPSYPGRRRLGLSVHRQSQSALTTAARKPTQNLPGR